MLMWYALIINTVYIKVSIKYQGKLANMVSINYKLLRNVNTKLDTLECTEYWVGLDWWLFCVNNYINCCKNIGFALGVMLLYINFTGQYGA